MTFTMPEENAYGIKIKKIVNLPQTTKILRNNLEEIFPFYRINSKF